MKDDKFKKPSYWIILAFAVVIFAIRRWGNELAADNLLLPVVVVLFVGAFAFVGFHVLKLWKHPDEEILGIQPGEPISAPPWAVPSFHDRLRFFLGAIAMVLFILVKEKQINLGSIIFCGLVLTIACIYFLPALIQKLRGRENEPLFANSKLRPEHFLVIPFGLFGVGFCGFFCFIVITKLPLQIAIPCLFPPLIIGSAFARPLVAGLRVLLRKEKDPSENHVRKKQEQDPWDRPDREL